MRQASPMPASMTRRRCGIIRSSRRAGAGERWARRSVHCRRHCRRRRSQASKPEWILCQRLASTPNAYWASWARAPRRSLRFETRAPFDRRSRLMSEREIMKQALSVGLFYALLALAGAAQALDPGGYRIIDLTHAFNERTVYWPTSPATFKLERLAYGPTGAGYFYAANSFCAPEHGGTHLDAPIHFAQGRRTADAIPLEQLVAPAVLIAVSKQAAADPDYRLTRDDVIGFEQRHGRIKPGTMVLLRTGWSRFWPDRKAYLGDDTPGDASKLRFPSYGEEAVRLLVEERKVGLLGVDTASIDYGRSRDFMVHRIAMAANVPGLENLTGLDQLPAVGATIIALPMKTDGGSGGPVRAIALVPKRP